MRNRYNPYAKPGQDQYGKVCFYIYNDDGTQVTGPTGPKFCYSAEKAAEMVKKAESAGKRVSPSSVSPGPRTAPGPAAHGRDREQSDFSYTVDRDASRFSYTVDRDTSRFSPPTPRSSRPVIAVLESKFAQLAPILNHHLVMSYAQSNAAPLEQAKRRAPRVQGIEARKKYAVIHSGTYPDRLTQQKRIVPEFVVNMETMEISRSDENGQPRDRWNFGTIDEVIARGQTLKPRQNPMGWV